MATGLNLRAGYNSGDYYHSSPRLKRVVDRLYYPIAGQDFSHIADYLVNPGYGIADPYMCLADFDSYMNAYRKAILDYGCDDKWASISLMNTAASGIFSSDNSIRKYAEEIWHTKPVSKYKI